MNDLDAILRAAQTGTPDPRTPGGTPLPDPEHEARAQAWDEQVEAGARALYAEERSPYGPWADLHRTVQTPYRRASSVVLKVVEAERAGEAEAEVEWRPPEADAMFTGHPDGRLTVKWTPDEPGAWTRADRQLIDQFVSDFNRRGEEIARLRTQVTERAAEPESEWEWGFRWPEWPGDVDSRWVDSEWQARALVEEIPGRVLVRRIPAGPWKPAPAGRWFVGPICAQCSDGLTGLPERPQGPTDGRVAEGVA